MRGRATALSLAILGTRGVPARHGGFETFAEKLALYLVGQGWEVTVYCQVAAGDSGVGEDTWNGVHRVNIPVRSQGALGTVEFDLRATWHAAGRSGVKLVLGYNTAVLNLLLRFRGRRVVMNMDGLEWQRSKWGVFARGWLRFNEFIGLATAHELIADHPEIARHLKRGFPRATVTMIPYGADEFSVSKETELEVVELAGAPFFLVVARVEPENSILEIVRAFAGAGLGAKLVVLGKLEPGENGYHAAVLEAADGDCIFPGAIYDRLVVSNLRRRAIAYVHGHTVGGTNPSLVEALGAGAAVIARDNVFNRWVAGAGALYFTDVPTCRQAMRQLRFDEVLRERLRSSGTERHGEAFTWPVVLKAYETVLERQAEPARE